MNENDFEEKSKDNLILYRGMENSNISNDFFNGKVYLSMNTNNIRGTGIYTTTSKECAEYYSDGSPFTLAKMFISKENSKILENDRLQEIKNIIKGNHPDEFSRFDGKNRDTFINDSARSYFDDRFNEEVKLWAKEKGIEASKEEIIAKLDENSLKEMSEKIKNDPETQKVLSKREKFFEDPESFCWYNDGLLTFLLGYDVLHSYKYLRDFHNSKEDEYLVINPKVLNILKITIKL